MEPPNWYLPPDFPTANTYSIPAFYSVHFQETSSALQQTYKIARGVVKWQAQQYLGAFKTDDAKTKAVGGAFAGLNK